MKVSYDKIIEEILVNTSIKQEDVFLYDDTPFEDYCDQIFQVFQSFLDSKNGLLFFNIAPAKFFFNNRTTINAWAWVNNDYSILSINIGTVNKLKTIFHDREDFFQSDNNLRSYSDLNDIFIGLNSSILDTMFDTGLMFLLYHESAHLIQKSSKVYDLLEEGIKKVDDFDLFNHQIEIDADIFAAINLGRQVLVIWDALPESDQTIENLEKIIAIVVSGIGIYRLFYLTMADKELYFEESTHPHIAIRAIIIVEHLVSHAIIEAKNRTVFQEWNANFDEISNASFDLMEYLSPRLFDGNVFYDFQKMTAENESEMNKYAVKLTALAREDENMACYKWQKLVEE